MAETFAKPAHHQAAAAVRHDIERLRHTQSEAGSEVKGVEHRTLAQRG